MADLQKILNKFNDLGIENKGLVPDDPMQQGQALKEHHGNNSTDPNAHARMVAESVQGKHIPGVTDTSASDMAALAGVGTPSQRPSPAVPNPNVTVAPTQTNNRWSEVDARLTNIENKLSSIVESIQRLSKISDQDYGEKRKLSLEKEREATTKESLERGFASFLKELEGN